MQELSEKLCRRCLVVQPISQFMSRKHDTADGYVNHCLSCRNARQRESRRLNGNATTKKYEKTKRGFLMRLYRNMKSRVVGVQKKCLHLYEGLEILPREDFYQWAMGNPIFHALFLEYEKSGYEQRLAPGVDRIDPEKGYTLDNMEIVTLSENVLRSLAIRRQRKQHQARPQKA